MKCKDFLGKYWLALFIIFSTLVRCIMISFPLVFEHDFITALWSMISRNIVLHGKYSPLYVTHPPLVIGLEVLSFFIFGISEFSARIIPILFSAFSIYYFYKLILEIYQDKKIAFWSTFIFSFSPLTLFFGRLLSAEPIIILFMITALYWYLLYARSAERRYLYLSLFSFLLACWTEPYGALVLFPIFYLSWKKRLGEFFFFVFIMCGSFLTWFLIVKSLDQIPGNIFKWSQFLLHKGAFWWGMAGHWFDMFTVIIAFSFIYAMIKIIKNRRLFPAHNLMLCWLAGPAGLFFAVQAWFRGHNIGLYYFLPAVAVIVGCLFAGMENRPRLRLILVILFLFNAMVTVTVKFSQYEKNLYNAAIWVRKHSESNEQIIFSRWVAHPPFRYYSERNQVHLLQLREDVRLEEIKGLRERNIRFLIAMPWREKEIEEYLSANYKSVAFGKYTVYDLKK